MRLDKLPIEILRLIWRHLSVLDVLSARESSLVLKTCINNDGEYWKQYGIESPGSLPLSRAGIYVRHLQRIASPDEVRVKCNNSKHCALRRLSIMRDKVVHCWSIHQFGAAKSAAVEAFRLADEHLGNGFSQHLLRREFANETATMSWDIHAAHEGYVGLCHRNALSRSGLVEGR